MDDRQKAIAKSCLEGAESNTMTFPQVVGSLIDAGFESYSIDFRRAVATYYGAAGDSIELGTHKLDVPVATAFDAALIRVAVKEAQQQVPGYTYKGFCGKAASAGCASYFVSFPGRRVLYVGRTAEVHVEHFPS